MSVRIDADLAGRESLKGPERGYNQETGFQRCCQVCLRCTLRDASPAPAETGWEAVAQPCSA